MFLFTFIHCIHILHDYVGTDTAIYRPPLDGLSIDCVDANGNGYAYLVNFFTTSITYIYPDGSSSGISTGSYSSLTTDPSSGISTIRYTNGDVGCGGIARSMDVIVGCAGTETLTCSGTVTPCTYRATWYTPLACSRTCNTSVPTECMMVLHYTKRASCTMALLTQSPNIYLQSGYSEEGCSDEAGTWLTVTAAAARSHLVAVGILPTSWLSAAHRQWMAAPSTVDGCVKAGGPGGPPRQVIHVGNVAG